MRGEREEYAIEYAQNADVNAHYDQPPGVYVSEATNLIWPMIASAAFALQEWDERKEGNEGS
jgi:hypothetical protein